MAAALLGALALATPLAAAVSPISISASPAVVHANQSVRLFGRLNTGARNQTVEVEMSECNGYGWRPVTQAETTTLGAWESSLAPTVTTKFRARWRDSTSNVVTVRARPYIFTDTHQHGRLLLQVRANDYFRSALLQRRAGTRWVRLRKVALGRGPFGSGADLRLHLPRGTRLRIVLTQATVGRCYLPAQATTMLT